MTFIHTHKKSHRIYCSGFFNMFILAYLYFGS